MKCIECKTYEPPQELVQFLSSSKKGKYTSLFTKGLDFFITPKPQPRPNDQTEELVLWDIKIDLKKADIRLELNNVNFDREEDIVRAAWGTMLNNQAYLCLGYCDLGKNIHDIQYCIHIPHENLNPDEIETIKIDIIKPTKQRESITQIHTPESDI